MTDIIVITIEEFNTIKNNVNTNLQIKEKYDSIFNKYECFFKTNIGTNGIIPKKTHPNKKEQQPYDIVHKSLHVKKIKTTAQEVTGLVNIMNRQNYNKILSKFRFLISRENIETVMNDILTKCCLQIVYKDLYMKLIMDLIELSGYEDIISNIILTFYNNYINNNQIEFDCKNGSCGYDLFCNQQKHKTLVLAKNILIVDLFKYKLLKNDINDYITNMISYCKSCMNDEYHLDIILTMLLHILNMNIVINNNSYNELTNILDNVLDNCPNKKIIFIIDNLYSVLKGVNHS